MQFITLADYLLLPIYLLIIYLVAYNYRNRKYPDGHPWRPYFIPGLTVKIVGAIFIGLLYQYYYSGGDTVSYFNQSKIVNSAFGESPVKWLNLMLHLPAWYDSEYSDYVSQIPWYTLLNTYAVIATSALVGILTFNTFLPSSILFAVISFTGIWALFRSFATQYPHLVRHLAIAVLFIPSTFVWGSGIFKDTLCMFALGWLTYSVFRILMQRDFSIFSIVMGVASFYLLAVIKLYILLAFLPAVALWLLFSYSHKIQSSFIRAFLKVAIAGMAAGGFFIFSNQFASEFGAYSLDNIAKTSTVTREYIYQVSGAEGGSAYSLGEFDPSIQGMLSKFPLAVNVSLFRPYLWEARKPIVFINALEAFLFLFLTLKIIFQLGVLKVWKAINGDPNIQFFLIFTLIFSFAVGISSYNFGSLSRYRIPCLPMYAMALMLIYYKYKPADKRFISIT